MRKNIFESAITVHNKKYSYTLEKVNKNITLVKCPGANINQEFLNEDVPDLLRDLPNLILSELKYKTKHEQVIRFRVSVEDKKLIMKKAQSNGYKTISSYLRDLVMEN